MRDERSSGVVEVHYKARLGNRLFQYCAGRIVATELGFGLEAGAIEGFPAAVPIPAPAGVPALTPPEEVVRLVGNRLNLPALRGDRGVRRVLLQGHFLRYEIFRPYKDQIRGWLAGQTVEPAAPDDLTIHIRSGDIWRSAGKGPVNAEYPALPYCFYVDIIRSRPWRRLLVVTEDASDPMVQKLTASFGAEVCSGSPDQDFRTLQASSNIVLSVSTFAWWAAWLSQARCIFFPVAGLFDRQRAARRPWDHQQDLWVSDEPRYQAVAPAGADRDWQGTEEERIRLLAEVPSRAASATAAPATGRTALAIIDAFQRRPTDDAPDHDSAAHLICQALLEHDRYRTFHLYRDEQRRTGEVGHLVLPRARTKVFDGVQLHASRERYAAVFVTGCQPVSGAPHLLRQPDDWSPVVCSFGTTHAKHQWSSLLVSMASGAVRATDGMIFKSRTVERLFREVCEDWSRRFGLSPSDLLQTDVIPDGVDVQANQRSQAVRLETRRRLRLGDRDLLFLSVSPLSPGPEGDLQALVVRWRDVLRRVPQAWLLLAGAVPDHAFVADLRLLAQAAGVGERVIVVDNPLELAAEWRGHLMSAADVLVHLGTGIEQTASPVVLEGMAHGLPVVATSWAAVPEIVRPGETGFLIDTHHAPVAEYIAATLLGQSEKTRLQYASKVVMADWGAFVDAVEALASQERRGQMGATSRQVAERHALPRTVRRYLDFFDASARAAERAWTGAATTRPLVDLDRILSLQATRPLTLDQKLRLGDVSRMRLLALGLHPEPAARLEQVITSFRDREFLSVAELAAAVARPPGPAIVERDPQRDLATTSRFLVRLLNFGVIEIG